MKSYHHGDLKNALLEAGIALLHEQGQEHFSLRKVAVKCGVSHTAPYSHFENKEALMEAMRQHVTKQFTEVLQKTAEQYKNDLNIMLFLGNAYVNFFMEHKSYFSFLYEHSNIKFDFSESGMINNTYAPCTIFKKAAFALMEKIDFPKEKRVDALLAMLVLVHGITTMLTTEQINYKGDWKSLLENSITANALFADMIQKRRENI